MKLCITRFRTLGDLRDMIVLTGTLVFIPTWKF